MIISTGKNARNILRFVTVVFIALCMLHGGRASAAPEDMTPEARKAMVRGLAAVKQQEWELALKYFKKAQKAAPYEPEVLRILAMTYDKTGQDFIAIPCYRAYLASAPDSPRAKGIRERIVELEVKVEADARKLIRRAIKTYPSMQEYLFNHRMAGLVGIPVGMSREEERRRVAESRKEYRDKHTPKPYARIAIAQTKAGDLAGARKTVARIPDKYIDPKSGKDYVRNNIDRFYYRDLVRDIVIAQAKAGDFTGAQKTASRIRSNLYNSRSVAYHNIIKAQAEVGDITGAMKTASMIQSESYKANSYYKIALLHIKAADIAAAKKIAARITRKAIKSSLYEHIAFAQTEAGDIAGAKDSASKITADDKGRAFAYERIILAQIKAEIEAGDIAGAKQTASRITDISDQCYAYVRIAWTQVRAGDKAGARKTIVQAMKIASRIKRKTKRSDCYNRIASVQINIGDFVEAKKTILLITWYEDQNNRYQEIATAQAETADISGAKETVSRISNKYNKSHAYSRIAEVQIKAGDKAGARKTLAQAMAALTHKDVDSTYGLDNIRGWQFVTCRDLAAVQVKIGNFPDAMKAASGITDLADQSYVYVNIAVAQAKAGDKSGAKKAFAQAMESASRITDEYRKSQAYSRITALQAGDKAEDKRAAAVMAAKAAKQERMNEEIRSWMALVAEKDFSNPVFTDFQGFMASLKDKNSYQIVLSLAKAAGEMADALKKLRAKETSWAKRRPKADE